MKIRKLLYLAIFSASITLSPNFLSNGQPQQLAQVDACRYCPAQLINPTITLSQLLL